MWFVVRLITLTRSTSMLLTSPGVQKRSRKKPTCITYRSAADMNPLDVEKINLWPLAPGSEPTQAYLFQSPEGKYYRAWCLGNPRLLLRLSTARAPDPKEWVFRFNVTKYIAASVSGLMPAHSYYRNSHSLPSTYLIASIGQLFRMKYGHAHPPAEVVLPGLSSWPRAFPFHHPLGCSSSVYAVSRCGELQQPSTSIPRP